MMYDTVHRSRSGFKIAEWSGNGARKHSRKPKRRTRRRNVKRLPPVARVRRWRVKQRMRHTTKVSWPDSRPPPAGVRVLWPWTATPPAMWPQPPISYWSRTFRHKARAPEYTICTTTICRTITDASTCKMAARVSIGPTLSEPYRLQIYRGPQKKSDGWWGWRLSIILHYAYCCIPNQAPLPYLNYPRKLVAEEVYHVVISTNNRMTRMATWLESDTGAGRGTKRNLSGDVEGFSPFQFFP